MTPHASRLTQEAKRQFLLQATDSATEAANAGNLSKVLSIISQVAGRRRPPKPGTVLSAEGLPILEPAAKRTRWQEYYSGVFNPPSAPSGPSSPPLEPTAPPPTDPSSHGSLPPLPEFDLAEVEEAIAALKSGKAPDPSGIRAEHFKFCGETTAADLHRIISHVTRSGMVPSSWQRSYLVPILKKGDPRKCENYRPIALVDLAMKVLARALLTRLEKLLPPQLHPCQAGLLKSRSTTDQLSQYMQQLRGQHEPLYVAFIDLTKAFDSIDRSDLWHILETRYKVDAGTVALLKLLYSNTSSVMFIDGVCSDAFPLSRGVKQGCLLATPLHSLPGPHHPRHRGRPWSPTWHPMVTYGLGTSPPGPPLCRRRRGPRFQPGGAHPDPPDPHHHPPPVQAHPEREEDSDPLLPQHR